MRKSIVRIRGRGKRRRRPAKTSRGVEQELLGLDTRVAMIQALISLGLKAYNDVLQEEVTELAGARYRREGGQPDYARWGGQQGSVYLADQKVGVRVPRVLDTVRDEEVPLTSYAGLQDARRADDAALRWVAAVNNWSRLGRWQLLVCKNPQQLGNNLAELCPSIKQEP